MNGGTKASLNDAQKVKKKLKKNLQKLGGFGFSEKIYPV